MGRLTAQAQDILFVLADLGEPGAVGGDTLLVAVVFPDGGPGERLGFFHQGEAGGEVTDALEFLVLMVGFKEREAEGAEEVAGADDPGGDAVDAGVEEIQTEVGAWEVVAADEFLGDAEEFVGERDHVVAVPANAAADVQQDFRHEAEDRGDFVGHVFGGVIMAGVEADELLVFHGVAEVELVHADRVAFGTDAEEFAFDGIEVVFGVELPGEDIVERGGEAFTGAASVGWDILHAIGDPDIGDRGGAERLAHGGADDAAGLAVFDPELADGTVVVGEREAAGSFGVGEERGVEVETDAERFGPVDPAAEVFGGDLVAIDFAAAEFPVGGMQVEAVFTGDQRERPGGIRAEFVRAAGLAGVVAGGHQSAGEGGVRLLEAADVIALPAVQRQGDAGELLEDVFRIDAEVGIAFAGEVIGFLDVVLAEGRHGVWWGDVCGDDRGDGVTLSRAGSAER